MSRARTIYIWEGPDAITITKGFSMKRSVDAPHLYNTSVKQKGLFTPYIPVVNIDEMFIGTSKKLMVSDKVQDGWEVIRIRKDFLTHEPYIPDIPPSVIANIQSLREELNIFKRKYFDAIKLNQDREQRDRFKGRVSEEFDWVAKQRNKFFGSGDSGIFGGGFMNRWGVPPVGGGQSGGGDD